MIDAYAADPAAPAGPPTLDEAVEMLAIQARNGVAASTVALVRHLAQRGNGTVPRPEDDPLFEVDQLAARRLREHAEDNGNGDAV